MRISPKLLVAGAALAVVGAGVAEAATEKVHTMDVSLPDGSVAHLQYSGDVVPRISVQPVDQAVVVPSLFGSRFVAVDPFAEMQRISAVMEMQHQAMLRQVAAMEAMQRQAIRQGNVVTASAGGTPGLTIVGDLPKGAHVSYYSSTTDAHGCTRTVSYSSDGSGAAPRVTKAASDSCDTPNGGASPIVPAKTDAPRPDSQAPGNKV